MTGLLRLAAVFCGLFLLVPSLRADDNEPDSAPAARAVRLSYVEGEVHLYQGSELVADRAVANTPLFEGARIDTGNDGRAEVQFEDGSVARLSPESSVTLSVLKGLSANSERDAEILLNGGLVYFELQGESDSNHVKVRFGHAELTAGGFTVLRINTDKAPGEVAVFSGNAHLEGGANPTLDLHGGESVALNAADPNGYNLAQTIEPDSWDSWNSDRDQQVNSEAGDQTAATENQPDNKNPAWNDLDANGNWYNVPDQGYVWTPNEAASNPDWDPYDNGYWMNSPGYGYMWVSGYPWGYLPYQCGAWNYYNTFGWGWAPGSCNPWWGGGSGWVINIGYAPPRYRYPVRPRPRNPRPMAGHEIPRPLIAVNRRGQTPGNTMPAPRDKTGTIMIAGRAVNPLRPIQQPRVPYNHPVPVFNTRPGINQPGSTGNPRTGFQGGNSAPRPIGVPARPGNGSSPTYGSQQPRVMPAPQPRVTPTPQPRVMPAPQPRPNNYYTPPAPVRPSGGTYSQPPPPRSAPPPSAPRAPSGGGNVHPSGGGGGGRPSGGPHH